MEDSDESMVTVCVTVRRSKWSIQPGGPWGPVNSATPLRTLKRGCVRRVPPPSPVVVRGREVMDPPSPIEGTG